MTYILLGILGLAMGSFLNVLIWRLPRNEDWTRGRSHCDSCGRVLRCGDLVPVLSWLWLKGRCRGCKGKISLWNPTIEILNAVGWMGLGWAADRGWSLSGMGRLGWEGGGLVYLMLCLALFSVLLTLLAIDWQYYIIPDFLIGMMLLIGLGSVLMLREAWMSEIGLRVFWGMAAGGGFAVLHWITKGKGMGWGDVKLALGMGALLKSAVLWALFSAFGLGAVVGLGLLASGKKKLRQPIPFGPFLVTGMVWALLYGDKMVEWYVRSFSL